MRKTQSGVAATVVFVMSACGGSDEESESGYDVEYDCQQSIACLERDLGPAPAGTLGDCIVDTRDIYESLQPAERNQIDENFSSCSDLTSCDYLECLGVDTGVTGTGDTCEPNLMPASGEVPTSVGAIPYSSVEARFWVNSEGCLTGIDVELTNGDCSLTFGAEGLIDQQGRYLINYVSLREGGLCPGYPEAINEVLYLETATDQPFGTITLTRDDVSWNECSAGQLLVEPEIVLEDFQAPPVDLTQVQFVVSGNFSRTHLQPIDGCPVVF